MKKANVFYLTLLFNFQIMSGSETAVGVESSALTQQSKHLLNSTPSGLQTPVAFILFNRPMHTARVFQAIRNARPQHLFLIADGPRTDREGESTRCNQARTVVEQAIDWDCQVHKNYARDNMGCRQRISSGLNWVFKHTEQAIILEDDCLPDPTFFRFCEELLSYYADDERIMSISGNHFVGKKRCPSAHYYYSQYMHCWGWATWRRAWQHYDPTMKEWPRRRQEGWLNAFTFSRGGQRKWRSFFDRVYNRELDTWDFAWVYSIWSQNGLNILPDRNLVSNIGFGQEATHTRNTKRKQSHMPVVPMTFPLKHPSVSKPNKAADIVTERLMFGGSYWFKPLVKLVRHLSKITPLKD